MFLLGNKVREAKTYNLQEYAFLLLPVLVLIIACIIRSSKKFFWNDELLSFYILSDPSFTHMMGAVSDRINQSPPLYFVMGWLWAQLFGATELSLGLLSSLSIVIALCLVWLVLRGTYPFWPTAIGSISTFCLSSLVFTHNTEIRMYGLLAATCAFGLFQYNLIIRERNCSWKTLAFNSVGHAAIVLTHLYGVLYSAAILVAFLLNDKKRGIFQVRVYFSILMGWLSLIPFLPYLFKHTESYKWFYPFPFLRLVMMMKPFPRFFLFLGCLVIISGLLRILGVTFHRTSFFTKNYSKSAPNGQLNFSNEFHLLLFATLFMLVPIVPWLINSTVKPILSEGNVRYFIPTMTLSWSIFLTHLASRILPNTEVLESEKATTQSSFGYAQLKSFILASFVGILMIMPIYRAHKLNPVEPGRDDFSYGYSTLPIAVEASHEFLPRFHYSSNPNRYVHIRDWETVLKDIDGVYAKGDYVTLEALNRNYPFIQSVQAEQFLKEHRQFLVLNDQDQKWFEIKIKSNPNYKTKIIATTKGAYGGLLETILVEHQ